MISLPFEFVCGSQDLSPGSFWFCWIFVYAELVVLSIDWNLPIDCKRYYQTELYVCSNTGVSMNFPKFHHILLIDPTQLKVLSRVLQSYSH